LHESQIYQFEFPNSLRHDARKIMKRKPATRSKTLSATARIIRSGKSRGTAARITTAPHKSAFQQVVEMIEAARDHAYRAVNTGLIDLYWRVGQFISRKIAADGWGRSTVSDLSAYIRTRRSGIRGFSASNLWRMRQFHDAYTGRTKLAALLRELNWTQNLLILARAKRPEEREFYLRLCVKERWPSRELERQLASARSLSPTLIAEYQTALPNKRLLERKLHEFYQLSLPASKRPGGERRNRRKS
jgi:predicted nuclease of restriction endonuclease-like (RecB) superfamily